MQAKIIPATDSSLVEKRIGAELTSKLLAACAPACPKCSGYLYTIEVTRYPGLWEWDEEKQAYGGGAESGGRICVLSLQTSIRRTI